MRRALVVLAACGAPPAAPISNVVPPPKGPSCVATGAEIASYVDSGDPVSCYLVDAPGDNVDCWRFDGRMWAFVVRKHRPELEKQPVTATPTEAMLCKPDQSNCKRVPLSGVVLPPDPEDQKLFAATNADRSTVAVWTHFGPIQVFDATGKQLAKIDPWWTEMAGEGNPPVGFREAHVLGNVIEVRIADTPISSAIRLYDTTGKQIADVFDGKPMDDTGPPGWLGGTIYAFMSIDNRMLVVVDVATGKQLAAHQLGEGVPLSSLVIAGTPSRIAGIVGDKGFAVAAGKVSIVRAPTCASPRKPPD